MSFIPTKIIGALIDSVSDDGAFAELSVKLANFGNTASTQIQIHSATAAQTVSSHGIEASLLDRYNEYYWKHDVWAQRFLENNSTTIVASEEYIRDEEFFRTEIYNDLLKPHHDYFRALGFVADTADGSKLVFGMHRTRTQPKFEVEIVSAMKVVQPGIIHLIDARRRIAAGRGRIAEHLMDAAADATLVVSRNGEIKFANLSAERGLEARIPLRAVGNFVSSDDPALAAWLRFRIAAAVAGRGGRVRTFIDGVGRSYRVSVDRLEGTNGHLACVRVRDELAALQRNVDGARATFGFTIAEAQLAEALLKGATPAQFAIAKGVRIPTVRSQLRSLFAKTGVTGQNELLIVLSSSGHIQS